MTQSLALLMTDVEGSTLLWRRAPQAMDRAMTRHSELVEEARSRYGGTRPRDQGEGDSAFLAFASVRAAVDAALHLQRALAAEPWPDDVRLRVRMAVGYGPVIPRDSNLFGDTVNRTARVRALAHGGQTLLTAPAYALVVEDLPEGASLVPLGSHRVKDVPEPIQLWQLGHEELEATFPPLRGADPAQPVLPRPLTSFVGRSHDIDELLALISRQRLVTVTGFGGIGKTRLVREVCASLATEGVALAWVELAAVTDPAQVPGAIGSALGLRDAGESMARTVTEHLQTQPLLLVLDNLEQVLDCRGFVVELLDSCPDLRLLATSRHALQVSGEVDFRLEPLPLSGPEPTGAPGPAVQLFAERAAAVQRGFTLGGDALATVQELCRLLDGMPLALELAAAQLRSLSLPGLQAALQEGLTGLRSPMRDVPDRQRTLLDTLSWSYRLLAPGEQELLARLSVFPAQASLPAIVAVCGDGDQQATLLTLDRLVTASLVQRRADRYSLLAPVREYAASLLTEVQQWGLREAHLDHYLAQSVAGAAVADSPLSKAWDAERHEDEPHFRAAIAHAHDAERAYDELLLVANLADLWLEQHLVDGIGLLQRARRCATAAGVDDARLLAFSASMQAFLMAWAGQFGAGRTVAEEGVRTAELPAGRALLPFALQARAEVQDDSAARRDDLERAVGLAGDDAPEVPWGGARAESVRLGAGSSLARLEHYRDPRRARQAAERLLDAARLAGRVPDVAGALILLAVMDRDVGDWAGARERLQECLRVLEGSDGLAHQRAHARTLLALTLDDAQGGSGDVSELAALAAELEAASLSSYAFDVLLRLGERLAVAGRHTEATTALRRCAAIADRLGSVRAAWPRWRLARLHRLGLAGDEHDVEAAWQQIRAHADRFLPEALSLLVDAAAAASAAGAPVRAAELLAHVRRRQAALVLSPVVQADLDRLLAEHPDGEAGPDLPTRLTSG